MRGSREISLVPSLHRASTDALINAARGKILIEEELLLTLRHNTFKRHCMTLDDILYGGTHHVMKFSPSENTPTRNYNVRSMRAWRRRHDCGIML